MEHKARMHDFSDPLFEFRSVPRKRLIASLAVTFTVMGIELAGGLVVRSMALVSDAGHMFTHAFAVGISLGAIYIARRPPCHHRTFGLYRAEILTAFTNGLFLIPVAGIIIFEAVLRIFDPAAIRIPEMLGIALIGLAANGVSMILLGDARKSDLNIRSVFFHLATDTLSSVAIIAGAVVIRFTGWTVIDPLLSLIISAAILYWSWSVLRESGRILLEMSPLGPEGTGTDAVSRDLREKFPEIREIRNIHFWTITPDMLVFSAHLRIRPEITLSRDSAHLISRINRHLRQEYRVIESTLQILPNEPESLHPGELKPAGDRSIKN
jgi:cobalt-zinc-cadmium efflux system protein